MEAVEPVPYFRGEEHLEFGSNTSKQSSLFAMSFSNVGPENDSSREGSREQVTIEKFVTSSEPVLNGVKSKIVRIQAESIERTSNL